MPAATNSIDAYNPTFYAQEALMTLQGALGMANRVYRAYEAERNSYGLGNTIQIHKPSNLEISDGGTQNPHNLSTFTKTVTLDQWKQVKMSLTDQEISKSGERIIEDHIQPAAHKLANQVDTDLCNLWSKLGNVVGVAKYNESVANSAFGKVATSITDPRRELAKKAGRMVDIDSQNIHMAVRPEVEANFIASDIFSGYNTTGGTLNQDSLLRGSLGTRFGVEVFRTHNMSSTVTSGTVVSGSDQAGATNGAHTKGATSIAIDTLAASETFVVGDRISFAGHDTIYSIQANVALSSNAATITIFPELQQDVGDGITATIQTGNNSDKYVPQMLFHRNAFALAMAPLPEIADGAGARISTVSDDQTGLAIRSRVAYDDDFATVKVTLDILYGVQCIEPDLAIRIQEDIA